MGTPGWMLKDEDKWTDLDRADFENCTEGQLKMFEESKKAALRATAETDAGKEQKD
jgi:hypothetical protein